MKKWIVVLSVFGVLLLGGVIYAATLAPDPAKVPAPADPAEPLEEGVVRISAEKFWQEFYENAVATRMRYENEILEVTGEIAEIGSGPMGDYVALRGDPEVPWRNLQFFLKDQKEKAATLSNLSKGDRVTIRGEPMWHVSSRTRIRLRNADLP